MFDRFMPNGRTHWNYNRALNSAERASRTLADFSTPGTPINLKVDVILREAEERMQQR